MKDINSPAKLLANIDATFICMESPNNLTDELDRFNPNDIYNKEPLADLFTKTALEIDVNKYEKVIKFNKGKAVPKVILKNN